MSKIVSFCPICGESKLVEVCECWFESGEFATEENKYEDEGYRTKYRCNVCSNEFIVI